MSSSKLSWSLLAGMWLLLAGSCTPAGSAPPYPHGGLEARPSGAPEVDYDARTLTTVDGQVLGADRVPVGDRLAGSVRLSMRADTERPVTVLLAPGWYLERSGVRFRNAERMEVRGSRVLRSGEPVIIASEVRQGETTVRLRDENGRPLWEE